MTNKDPNRPDYTEEEVTEFLEYALELGSIDRACRDLGWPSTPTGYKWAAERNVDVAKARRQMMAAQMRHIRSETEDILVFERGIDRIEQILAETPDLDGAALDKLMSSLERYTRSKQLLLGRATERIDQMTNNGFDAEIERLVEELNEQDNMQEQT